MPAILTAPRRRTRSADPYFAAIDAYPLLSAAEEVALAGRIRAGDAAARDRLACSNLRLVVSIAKHFRGRGLGLDDLIQAGNEGVLRATGLYDPTRHVRFSTYATYWIQQTIRRTLQKQASTIRVPIHLLKTVSDQIRGHATPARAEANGLLAAARQALRIDHADAVKDGYPDHAPEPADALIAAEDLASLPGLLATLDMRSRAVIRGRYGLGSGHGETLLVVGHRLGLSRERVRQIENEAIRTMRVTAGLAPGCDPAPSAYQAAIVTRREDRKAAIVATVEAMQGEGAALNYRAIARRVGFGNATVAELYRQLVAEGQVTPWPGWHSGSGRRAAVGAKGVAR